MKNIKRTWETWEIFIKFHFLKGFSSYFLWETSNKNTALGQKIFALNKGEKFSVFFVPG